MNEKESRTKRCLSWLLVAAGAVLLFFGGRDLLESRFGQNQAERDFANSAPQPVPDEQPETPQRGDTMAKLMIPRLDAQLYVVEGDGARELRRGPGHLTGTAMPGANGNCVIAGHRDTHFRVLKDIRKGDDIVLETRTGKYLYRVRSVKVVSPKNTESLQPTSEAELNLITCFPFYYVGSAPKRFVVEAQLAGSVAYGRPAGHAASGPQS
jgi:sortase A